MLRTASRVASFTTKALKDNTKETEENDKDRSTRVEVSRLTGKWTASEMVIAPRQRPPACSERSETTWQASTHEETDKHGHFGQSTDRSAVGESASCGKTEVAVV